MLNAKTGKDAGQRGVSIGTSFQGCGLTKQTKILRLGNKCPDSAIPVPENKTTEQSRMGTNI